MFHVNRIVNEKPRWGKSGRLHTIWGYCGINRYFANLANEVLLDLIFNFLDSYIWQRSELTSFGDLPFPRDFAAASPIGNHKIVMSKMLHIICTLFALSFLLHNSTNVT